MTADHLVDHPQAKGQHLLRLRLLDPRGRAKVIRLRDKKASIGGSPSCSIQIEGPQVRPVHCLIICGQRKTIVRNLSPGNTLNGEGFTDAPLSAGDHLQLGGYDLEVLGAAGRRRRRGPLDQTPSSLDLASAIESRMNRLEEQLFDLQRDQTAHKIGQLQSTIEQLESTVQRQQRRYRQQRERWREQQQELLDRLKSHDQQVERLGQEAARLRQQQHEQVEVEQQQVDLSAELASLNESLETSQAEQTRLQKQWELEKSKLDAQLNTARKRIVELEQELFDVHQRRTEATESKVAEQAKTSEMARSLEQLATQLADTQRSHAEERAAWEQERAELEQQLVSSREQLNSRIQQLETELESERCRHQVTRDSWEDAQSAWEAEQADRASHTDAHAEQEPSTFESPTVLPPQNRPDILVNHADPVPPAVPLNNGPEDLTRTQPLDTFDAPPNWTNDGNEGSFAAPEFTTPDPSSHDFGGHDACTHDLSNLDFATPGLLDRGIPEGVSDDAPEPTGDLQHDALALDQAGADKSTRDVPADESPVEDSVEDSAEDTSAEDNSQASDSPPEPGSPVGAADVLGRLGLENEEPQEHAEIGQEERQPSADAEDPQSPHVPSLAEVSQMLGKSADDDSIEAYMDRLLARVRGDQPPASPAVTPTPSGPLVEDSPATKEQPAPPADTMVPRRKAPEQDLAAMRSLANESARSAIQSHAERSWTEAAKYQLFGAALGATCGIATFISLDTRPVAGFAILLIGLSAAGVFTLKALAVRRKMLERGREETDREDGPETPRQEGLRVEG